MSVPSLLRLSIADDGDARLIRRMLDQLTLVNPANDEARSRYEGSWAARQFGISIPPNMQGLATPTGWDGSVVDILEERLDWLGWTSEGDDFGLPGIY